jgi:uncharacterized protein
VTLDPEDIGSNDSPNRTLTDVLSARLSRRDALRGGVAVAALSFFGGSAVSSAQPALAKAKGGAAGPLLGFQSIPVSVLDDVVVPPGYSAQVLIPWGTPLQSDGPAWKADGSNTADDQAQQLGMSHDGMHFFSFADQGSSHRGGKADERGKGHSKRGLLVLNHEATDQVLLFKDGFSSSTRVTTQHVQKSLNAHGVTVIEVVQRNGRWTQVDSPYNRRITGSTPVTFSGPLTLEDPRLASKNPAMGTLNNCAHGYTPWGTYLACEENFNGYFGTTQAGWQRDEVQRRYGISAGGSGYRWHEADSRFDIAVNPREADRFGWVTEIDPFDPTSTPVKRTALGRFKHESCAVTESDGTVVVYSGDDENLEYVYKFVGAGPWKEAIGRGASPLDEGRLYVARFDDDGTGEWLPLVFGEGPLTAPAWVDQADVVWRARAAADALGATKLHRPEWVAVDERTKDVYLTLTNGSDTTPSSSTPTASSTTPVPPRAVSPRAADPYGSIIKWTETGGDNRSLTFEWDVFLLAGDSSITGTGETINGADFGSPDGIWSDDDGRLWIQTDVSNGSQRRGDYRNLGNNMMLAADPVTREVKRFLVGPNGCEITGVITTPDRRTMFVNIQHPGEATSALGAPTPAEPGRVSNWPDGTGTTDKTIRPRSATVVITKDDGGVIGT